MTVRKRGVLGIPQVIDPGVFGQAAAGNAAAAAAQQQQTATALGGALGNPGAPGPTTDVGYGQTATPQQKNPAGWSFGAPSGTSGVVGPGQNPQTGPGATSKPSLTGNPPAPPVAATPGLAQGAGQAPVVAGVTPTAWSGMTGGHTGSTYNIQGFNPWANLAQYNGGVYQTGEGLGGHAATPSGEDDMNRVFRWTNDILRARGIAEGSPEAAQIFAANVERLKSEYAAQGLNWQTSKFANFGAPGSQQQGQQPNSNVAPPASTSSVAAPASTNTGGPPPPNANPGDVNPNNPNEKVVVNPTTGQKSYSALQDIALAGSDPDQVNTRRAMMMQSLGLDPTAQGLFYESVNKNLGDAMDRYLALQGIAPGTQYGTITGNMQNFENMVTSGDYYGQLHNNTAATRQAFLNGGTRGLNTGQQLSVLDQILGQQAEGMNPVLAQAMAQRSQQARTQIGIDSANQLGQGRGEVTDPVAWLRNSRWADLLG